MASFDKLNLSIVDEAFGPSADLYQDVLHVPSNASARMIQRAYFDRRNELFRILSDLDQYGESNEPTTEAKLLRAERKMDAVVTAGRILGDSVKRSQYDDMLMDRLNEGAFQSRIVKSPQLSGEYPRFDSVSTKELTAQISWRQDPWRRLRSLELQTNVVASVRHEDTTVGKPQAPRARTLVQLSQPRRVVSPEKDHSTVSEYAYDSGDDDQSATVQSEYTDVTLMSTNRRDKDLVSCIKNEVMGCFDDHIFEGLLVRDLIRQCRGVPSSECFQVLNVFTLQDADIMAVTRRIDKAKTQMDIGL
jgi:hypothetical protein